MKIKWKDIAWVEIPVANSRHLRAIYGNKYEKGAYKGCVCEVLRNQIDGYYQGFIYKNGNIIWNTDWEEHEPYHTAEEVKEVLNEWFEQKEKLEKEVGFEA
jgi:hypothetical protein